MNYLLRLALNHGPPDFCLPHSWDYSHEPPVATKIYPLNKYLSVQYTMTDSIYSVVLELTHLTGLID
jgi:hypothetical protein